ncbi:MAG TPA: transglycosylase SLT domain-containing protein [Chloroflexota bacterium]|nr:transglycosylase SLT domain-containing protein [Chloroflexota bacterium]
MRRVWGAVVLIAMAGMMPALQAPVRADDATPTLPAPTFPATEAPPTVTPSPLPVVQVESSPVATAAVAGAARTSVPAGATAVPQPVPTEAPPPATAYLPSPAQLEESARLRWGNGIPASVRRWAFLVVPISRHYHLDPVLVAAVITMESNGDPTAWNQASDARGLMQVLHGPFDPAHNIRTGCRMLAGFLREFGRLDLALAAYNAGPGAVIAYGGVPPYRETRDYVIVVTYLYDLFGHHHLSPTMTARYRRTLRDLRRFRDQRKKIRSLAAAAHLDVRSCGPCTSPQPFPNGDAFWPIPGLPDPLQRVGP